jgi:hypothetical protein
MGITWDEIVRELRGRGFRYYSSVAGPIPIEVWTGPDGGTWGHWVFVGHNSIMRQPGTGDSTVYSFS